MIPLILGALAGLFCGVISGLIPGIHSNTMAGIMLGFSPALLSVFGPEGLAAAFVSLLISHSFLEILPSTFFGIPDAGTALSVLPAHALTLEGKGQEAVRLSSIGGIYGVIIGLPVSILAYLLLTPFQGYIDWMTGCLLVFMMGLVIISEDSPVWALVIFGCAGILGLFSFRFEYLTWSVVGESSILMPLLTGLFGLSVILTGSQGPIPRQRFSGVGISPGDLIRSAIPGTCAGLLVGWLPGLSTASSSAVVSAGIRYDTDRRRYLVANGAATTANAVIGLAAFYGIERTRNGVMVALSSLNVPSFPVLLTVCAGVSLVAYYITVRFSGSAYLFSGVRGSTINIMVGGFVILLSAIFTGPFGLLILACSTGIGFIPYLLNLSRVTCMGAVTVPVILYSFGVGGF
ncbi:MAG: tripartite tricarboxylate transporter permease [Methanobacteriota archaeon]